MPIFFLEFLVFVFWNKLVVSCCPYVDHQRSKIRYLCVAISICQKDPPLHGPKWTSWSILKRTNQQKVMMVFKINTNKTLRNFTINQYCRKERVLKMWNITCMQMFFGFQFLVLFSFLDSRLPFSMLCSYIVTLPVSYRECLINRVCSFSLTT